MFSLKSTGVQRCDGVSRREFLRIGGLGTAGLMLPDLLRAQSATSRRGFGSAKTCILLFMSGGPPQVDTFDLKPDAPIDVRGEFKPIKTSVPGIEISEYFPMLARHADKYAIVRSVTHDCNIHTVSAHAMLTGNPYPKAANGETPASPTDFPHYGAVLTKLRPCDPHVPTYVSMPQLNTNTDGTIWPGQGGGFLGSRYDPLRIKADYVSYKTDPNSYMDCRFHTPDLTLPVGVDSARVDLRRELLATMEQGMRVATHEAEMGLLDQSREQAFNLLSSGATQRAFDLDREPDNVKERYGRHLFGKGCLLARRLAQAGVPLITIYWHPDGTPTSPCWDTHADNYKNLKGHLMTPCDRAFSALLEDLSERGMLDETLVVWMGEFGRSPRINGAGGRDHWSMCQSIVMAGGGIRGGQVYGCSDATASAPAENAVTPGDIGATIYTLLGVRPDAEIVDQTGRPHPLVHGDPIAALI